MVGSLAQIIALATYGNAYIETGSIPTDFDTSNTTFQFCNMVDFREIKKVSPSSEREERVIALSPHEWFEYLKTGNCKYLRLYYEGSKDKSITKDYKRAGFVGGGGVWFIEAVYNNHSNYWAARWDFTNENVEDRKNWTVKYGLLAERQHTRNIQIDMQLAKDGLKHVLTEITDFALRQDMKFWADIFKKAESILDSASPEENFYHKDLVPIDSYPLSAKQIIFSAGTAWVFGGMGSWNDQGFGDKGENDTYERLSEQLYSKIIEAIIAGINTAN